MQHNYLEFGIDSLVGVGDRYVGANPNGKLIVMPNPSPGGSDPKPDKTLFVSPTFPNATPFHSDLMDALNVAQDGYTIIVYTGVYAGDHIVDKEDIVLIAMGRVYVESIELQYQSTMKGDWWIYKQLRIGEPTQLQPAIAHCDITWALRVTTYDSLVDMKAHAIDNWESETGNELQQVTSRTIGRCIVREGNNLNLRDVAFLSEVSLYDTSKLELISCRVSAYGVNGIDVYGEDVKLKAVETSFIASGGTTAIHFETNAYGYIRGCSFFSHDPNALCITANAAQRIHCSGGNISNVDPDINNVTFIGETILVEPLFEDHDL